MVIARLLTPAQIGVYSVTMVLLYFVSSLRDMGAGQYLVQERELTPARIRAAWTVQLCMGVAFGSIVTLASHPVALFYKEPIMFDMMLILAINFILSPFGSLTYAHLMREMKFGKLAVMRFTSNVIGTVVTLTAAWNGQGAMSLAYGSLAATAGNALCSMAFRPAHFPWLPGATHEVGRVLRFGSKISATAILNTAANGSPELALGKLQNMTEVGFFSRANGLASMFHRLVLDAVNSVAVSLFAKDARSGIAPKAGFLRALAYVTVLGWYLMGLLAIFAPAVLAALYGSQWGEATTLSRLLLFGMSAGLVATLCPVVLTSLGLASQILKITLMACGIYITFMIVGAIAGTHWIGGTYIAANIITALLWLRVTAPHLKATSKDILRPLTASLKVTFYALIPAAGIYYASGIYRDSLYVFIAGTFFSFFGFVAAIRLTAHPINTEMDKLILAVRRN